MDWTNIYRTFQRTTAEHIVLSRLNKESLGKYKITEITSILSNHIIKKY